jgi:CO dehydrogenase maturation factor
MPYHIALAGKGSAGKSSLLPLVIASVRQRLPDARILVVDADPQQGATHVLGLFAHTLGDLLHEHAAILRNGAGLTTPRDTWLTEQIGAVRLQMPSFDFLAMGRSTAPGCQCIINNLLGRALKAVIQDYDILITDNEAGLEHLGRFADLPIDLLLLIALPDPLFLDVAAMIDAQGRAVGRTICQTTLLLNQATASEVQHLWRRLMQLERGDFAFGGAIPVLPDLRRRPVTLTQVGMAPWWPSVSAILASALVLEEDRHILH